MPLSSHYCPNFSAAERNTVAEAAADSSRPVGYPAGSIHPVEGGPDCSRPGCSRHRSPVVGNEAAEEEHNLCQIGQYLLARIAACRSSWVVDQLGDCNWTFWKISIGGRIKVWPQAEIIVYDFVRCRPRKPQPRLPAGSHLGMTAGLMVNFGLEAEGVMREKRKRL